MDILYSTTHQLIVLSFLIIALVLFQLSKWIKAHKLKIRAKAINERAAERIRLQRITKHHKDNDPWKTHGRDSGAWYKPVTRGYGNS